MFGRILKKKKPRQPHGQRVQCELCGQPTLPYWHGQYGLRREAPLCRDCHERDLARQTRHDSKD